MTEIGTQIELCPRLACSLALIAGTGCATVLLSRFDTINASHPFAIHQRPMPQQKINNYKSANSLHSVLLILFMCAWLGLIGWMLFKFWGCVIAIGLAVLTLILGDRMSPRIVLAMYKAKPILPSQSPQLAEMFYLLCRRAELDPMPGLFYIPTKLPNAFAVGHDETAAVAVTDGLLRCMNPRELEGILAHEISHLRHRDTFVMGIADTIGRVTSILSRAGLLMMLFSFSGFFTGQDPLWYLIRGSVLFFAPAVSVLLQLALSRKREFNADMGAVELTADAYGLASALDKLERLSQPQSIWRKILAPGQKQTQPAILRTHPETEARIRVLLDVARKSKAKRPAVRIVSPRMAPAVRVSNPRRIPIGFEERVRTKPRYRIMSGVFR